MPTPPMPPRAAVLALALASRVATAACTGTDATELSLGCEITDGTGDFFVKFYGPPGTVMSTDAGVRAALYRTVVVVHGYGVARTTLPPVAFEDGTPGVFEGLFADKIGVVSLAPGRSKEDSVEDDAAALRQALALLDGYRTDAASPLVVIGHSMGGLAARIALADMEADGEDHGVALYVSIDAPHSGVNVPHGMQMLKVKMDEWAAMTEEDFIAVDPGWEGVFDLASLSGVATSLDPEDVAGFPDPTSLQAQQMTIQGAVAPEAYPAFMALLAETGFPEQPHKVAISNGNTGGVGCMQAVAAGGELFWFTGAKGNSAASVRGTFQVFTDLPGAYSFKSDVYYDGFFQNHDGGEKNARTPDDDLDYDHVSGGTLDYAAEMAAAAEANADDFHEPSWRQAADSAIPFVPTWSALALPVGTSEVDVAAAVAAGGTPFDEVYAIGDFDAFDDNVDHNTLVLPDAVLAALRDVLACHEAALGDTDGDGVDDACDDDDDNDGAFDAADPCPTLADDHADADADGLGDACDDDVDGDGAPDTADNCLGLANDQADEDEDGLGDACDPVDDTPGGASACGCAASPTVPWGSLALLAWAATRRARRGPT